MTLPQWPPGTYYLILNVDDGDGIVESNYLNNAEAIPITLTVPDLAPVSVSTPASGVANTPIQVVGIVTNQGNGAVSAFWYDGIYFSSSPVFGTNATLISAVGLTHNVAAGGSYTWTNSVGLPQVPAGTYYVFVVVDDPTYGYVVYESTKTNNTSTASPITVTVPDLAPVSVSAPVSGVSGSSIQIACVVTNQGSGSASGNWCDGIYFSSSPVFGTNATQVASVGLTHNVAGGSSYAWTNSVNLPQVPAGSYYLFVVVDDPTCGNVVYESTKTNNTSAALPLAALTPDLAPVSVSAPVSGVSGSSIQIACVVTNQGSGSASGNWCDGIYFSSSPVFGTNATQVASVGLTHNVAGGSSYAWTNSVNLPQVPAGSYYLFVVVDDPTCGNVVYESTKTNNTSAALPLAALTPDLAPVSVSAPVGGVGELDSDRVRGDQPGQWERVGQLVRRDLFQQQPGVRHQRHAGGQRWADPQRSGREQLCLDQLGEPAAGAGRQLLRIRCGGRSDVRKRGVRVHQDQQHQRGGADHLDRQGFSGRRHPGFVAGGILRRQRHNHE